MLNRKLDVCTEFGSDHLNGGGKGRGGGGHRLVEGRFPTVAPT